MEYQSDKIYARVPRSFFFRSFFFLKEFLEDWGADTMSANKVNIFILLYFVVVVVVFVFWSAHTNRVLFQLCYVIYLFAKTIRESSI